MIPLCQYWWLVVATVRHGRNHLRDTVRADEDEPPIRYVGDPRDIYLP